MNKFELPTLKAVLLCSLMIGSAFAASALKPEKLLADLHPAVVLDTVFPASFGDWRLVTGQPAQIVNPETKAFLESIYSDQYNQVYINAQGQKVMLSVAYGKNQSGDQSMHYPEVCYPAQGFEIKSRERDEMALPGRKIPVTKLVARNSNRIEPITYWVLIGDEVAKSGFLGRLIKLKYAVHGLIPDGLLFRVSSIGANPAEEWAIQRQFVHDLMDALPNESGVKIAGLKQ